MNHLNRWLIAVTAIAGIQLAQAETTLRIQDYPGTGNLLVRVAQANGYCKAEGLNCELKTIAAAPLGLQTMLSGDIDIAYGPTEVAAAALVRKAPIKIIGAGFTQPVFFLVAGAKVKLENESKGYPEIVKSFKGLKIGVTQRGSGAEFQAIDMLRDAGLSANDVTFVAVGAPNTAFPALAKGQVDLAMTFSPADGMCEVLKACRVIVDPRKGEGPASVMKTSGGAGVLMVKADWAQENAAAIEGFRNALDKAEAFVKNPANFDATLAVLNATFGLQLPDADKIAAITLRNSSKTFRAQGDVTAMQAVADGMTDNKLIPAKVDMAAAVLAR
jgi:NitT/TauT family transport system substrate-binding protein